MSNVKLRSWFAKFRAGDLSPDNAPWSGGPAEVDRDQIKTLIENSQHSTTQEIADILKMSKSVKSLVKMKNASFIFQKKINRLSGEPNKISRTQKDKHRAVTCVESKRAEPTEAGSEGWLPEAGVGGGEQNGEMLVIEHKVSVIR